MTTIKPEPKRSAASAAPDSPAFANVVNLLAVYSEAAARLEEIAAKANSALLDIVDQHKTEYASLQQASMKAEAALELECRSHPEWFVAAKSIKTPYGKVAFRSGTSLEIRDDEATVKLLRAVLGDAGAADYIRTEELPNLEALEKLSDAELARFMVKRVARDAFSVTAAKVDFAAAVKEAAAKTN